MIGNKGIKYNLISTQSRSYTLHDRIYHHCTGFPGEVNKKMSIRFRYLWNGADSGPGQSLSASAHMESNTEVTCIREQVMARNLGVLQQHRTAGLVPSYGAMLTPGPNIQCIKPDTIQEHESVIWDNHLEIIQFHYHHACSHSNYALIYLLLVLVANFWSQAEEFLQIFTDPINKQQEDLEAAYFKFNIN